MALTDAETIQALQTDLALGWENLQGTLSTDSGATAMSQALTVRALIDSEISDTTDYVNGSMLASAFHTVIAQLPGVINSAYALAPNALDTYFIAQTGQTFRIYWTTGITWNTNFRALWRNATAQEIIVRLGSVINTGGTWGSFTADQAIGVDVGLELHTVTECVAGATVTCTFTHMNPNVANSTVNVYVQPNTASGTVIPIGADPATGLSTFNGVASVTVSGGDIGDDFEIWVAA